MKMKSIAIICSNSEIPTFETITRKCPLVPNNNLQNPLDLRVNQNHRLKKRKAGGNPENMP